MKKQEKAAFVEARTDKYFTKSKNIARKFGERTVKYGVFQRRDVIVAAKPAVDFIKEYCPTANVIQHFEEGTIVPPRTKILTIEGPFTELVELETLWLQRLGFTQTCAYNAYKMSLALPNVPFLDMHGRHATGDDMVKAAAYGAAVGSKTARLQGAKGFIGTSNDLTAEYFPIKHGLGTMPHAIIGYAGVVLEEEWEEVKNGKRTPSQLNHSVWASSQSAKDYANKLGTLLAMQMYVDANPNDTNIVALVDYFGQEVTDSITCAKWFYDEEKLHEKGRTFGVRLDTNGERFLEGLDWDKSVEIVSKWLGVYPIDEYAVVRKVVGNDVFDAASDSYIDNVRKILFGKGVSAANIMHMRKSLNRAGYSDAQIIASSGFDLFKCQIMAKVNAPISVVGTGSFLPKSLSETYTTADIYRYDNHDSVKVGREWLMD